MKIAKKAVVLSCLKFMSFFFSILKLAVYRYVMAKNTTSGSFRFDVYACVQSIPRGRVMTYGSVAARCGRPRAARLVGWAMFSAHFADIPWQRVVGAGGYITIKNPNVTAETQKMLLEKEGLQLSWDKKKEQWKIEGFSYAVYTSSK